MKLENKGSYLQFNSIKEIDDYTKDYANLFTGISGDAVDRHWEKLKAIINNPSAHTKNWSEEQLKTFYGYKVDDDLSSIAKECSISSFINAYCGGNYYRAINEHLRFGSTAVDGCFYSVKKLEIGKDGLCDVVTMKPEEVVEMMNDVFCKYPTKDDMVLWRFIDTRKGTFKPFGNFLKKNLTEKGFLSCASVLKTSMQSNDFDHCDLVMKIFVPKGTPSFYVDYISKRSNEKEWLFPPETTLKQVSRPKKFFGKQIVECYLEVDKELLKRRDRFIENGEVYQPTYENPFKKPLDKTESLAEKLDKIKNKSIKENDKPKEYTLVICKGEPEEEIVNAILTKEEVSLIHQDMAGLLNSQSAIITVDGREIETGIIDEIKLSSKEKDIKIER